MRPLLKASFFIIILLGSLTILPNTSFACEYLTLTASPRYIPADGTSTSILTAKLSITYGAPVGGYTVYFWIDQGSGTINPLSAVTDSSGYATTTYTSSTTPSEVLIKARTTVQIPPERGGGTKTVSGMVKVYLVGVEIKAFDGESAPPKFIAVDATTSFKAKTLPIPLAGTFKWNIIKKKNAEIQGSATSQSVTLKGITPSKKVGDTGLKVMFKPTYAIDYTVDIVDVTVVKVEIVIDKEPGFYTKKIEDGNLDIWLYRAHIYAKSNPEGIDISNYHLQQNAYLSWIDDEGNSDSWKQVPDDSLINIPADEGYYDTPGGNFGLSDFQSFDCTLKVFVMEIPENSAIWGYDWSWDEEKQELTVHDKGP